MPETTLMQRRIKYALDCITKLQNDGNYGNYVSYVKAFPASILIESLGQALATLLAQAKNKPGDAHRILYDHISNWLCGNCPDMPYPNGPNLLVAITTNGQNEYMRAQAEALSLLTWLKKFAVAFLEEEKKK